MISDALKFAGILALLLACAAVAVVVATPMAKVRMVEAETARESQRALAGTVEELVAELREERRFQREQYERLVDLLEGRGRPDYTGLAIVLTLVGGMAAGLLLRRERTRGRVTVVMLPPKPGEDWLAASETAIEPWERRDAVRVIDMPRLE